jgi:hypothetical protein
VSSPSCWRAGGWKIGRKLIGDVDLALALSMRLQQEWHVLMILIIMVATLFFCHSLVRLAIDLTIGGSPGNRDDTHDFARIPSIAGPGGYAMPRTPIRVNMQEPEIMSGMKEPPPVYGLWRCSYVTGPTPPGEAR